MKRKDRSHISDINTVHLSIKKQNDIMTQKIDTNQEHLWKTVNDRLTSTNDSIKFFHDKLNRDVSINSCLYRSQ